VGSGRTWTACALTSTTPAAPTPRSATTQRIA